jgi:hypothetical protein
MNEADRRLLEDADRRLAGLGPFAQPMPLETAVSGTPGDRTVDAAPHHFGDIIERQLQSRSQLADQCFFQRQEFGHQPLRCVRSVGHCRSTAPTIDRRLAHPQFVRKLRDRLPAALDIRADFRGCRGISVQVQLHDARRSLIYEMPRSTPIPSNQSPGTEHFRGDERNFYIRASIQSQLNNSARARSRAFRRGPSRRVSSSPSRRRRAPRPRRQSPPPD